MTPDTRHCCCQEPVKDCLRPRSAGSATARGGLMTRHTLRAGIGLGVLVTLLTAACAAPPTDRTGAPEPTPPLSAEVVAKLEERCADATEAMGESREALAAALRDIEGLVGSSPQAEAIRAEVAQATGVLAQGPAEELTGEQIRRVGPTLVALSEHLVDLGAAGCATLGEAAEGLLPPTPADPGGLRAAVEENRELWRSQGIPTYYLVLSVHLEESLPEGTEPPCGAFGWLLIQVVDGETELAVDRFSGCRVDPEVAERRGVPLGVEDLFDLVAAHADAGVVRVDWHPDWGYPQRIFVEGEGTVIEVFLQEFGAGLADLSRPEAVLAELESSRRLWGAQDIEDYSFTVEVDCFCPPEFRGPFEVKVSDGEIAQATLDGEPIRERVDREFLTVEGLFRFVERNAYADAIDVTNHSRFGYPLVIDIDPVRNAIDEEIRVEVLEFSTQWASGLCASLCAVQYRLGRGGH